MQLLALVDEVAVDTVTRGALKDDATFKGLRDVIKKCNRVLEDMLVRRERKYTLFFRLVQPHDRNEIDRMKAWNEKVEKAVGSVTGGRTALVGEKSSGSEGDTDSTASGSSASSGGSLISRGRQLLPTAGKVRSRRATPTPKMRRRRGGPNDEDSELDESAAGEDGYSTVTAPVMPKPTGNVVLPGGLQLKSNTQQRMADVDSMAPKDELVDVIRGLRVEKLQNNDAAKYVSFSCCTIAFPFRLPF